MIRNAKEYRQGSVARTMRLNQAQMHMQKRDYTQAIAEFTRSIHLAPEEPSYYWHRAEAYFKALDFDSAMTDFKQHELLTPITSQASHQNNREPFTIALQPDGTVSVLHGSIANGASNGPYHKSITPDPLMESDGPLKSKSVYVITKRMAYVAYLWGQCLLDQQRFSEALAQFYTAQRLRFRLDSVLLRIALAKIGLAEIDDATEILYALIDMNPKNADLYILRAKIYRSLRNVDFANIDLQHAIKLAPKHPEIPDLKKYILSVAVDLKNKASQQIIKKQPNTAIWYLNHAIELDADDWTIVFKRGVLLAEIHNYDGALEDLLNVLSNDLRDTSRDQEIKNHIGSVYNKVGIIAYQNAAYDEAYQKFTTALTFNSAEPVVWKNRSDCLFAKRDIEGALRDLEQCYRLNPEDSECKKRLGTVLATTASRSIAAGRYRTALDEIDQAIFFDKSVGDFHFEKARALYFLDVSGWNCDSSFRDGQ
eukprot:jgi/Hompol1/6756/HPOL_005071-RA